MLNSAILCVDDEVEILRCLKEQLKRAFGQQYMYEIAQSAEEALLIIDELHADKIKILIIVSDWLMPGVRGDELLIQVHHRFPKIITVMLTGQADEVAIERARKEANLYAFITKPWTESELKKIIVSALG
jgi:DNA-binding NtrC family response regulator